MKRILLLTTGVFLTIALFSQPANDECATATVIGAASLDDGNGSCNALLAEDNTDATGWELSPGLFYTGTCWGGAIDSVVFYSFTAQGVSGMIEVTNGPDMSHIAILEFTGAACDATNALEIGCAVDAAITFDNQLTIGTTYYVVVGFAGNAVGTFDLCVFNPVPAPNDECMNAIDIADIDGNCNTGLTNYYPSSETFIPACFPANGTTTVWYKFVAQGVSVADLHIENGPGVANVAILDFTGFAACDLANGLVLGCQANVDQFNPIVLDNQLTIGTEYYVVVSFDDVATGTFDLCLDNPVPAFNDDCMNAPMYPPLELNDSTNCLMNIAGNDLNNDWPSTDIGQTFGCFNADATYNVWFQFTAQGPDVDINVDPAFGQVEQIALIEFTGAACDPDNWVIWDCANGDDLEINNQLELGHTYYVAVGFSNNGVGDYCINVFNPEPPVNDTMCAAIPFPLAGTSQVCEPNQTTSFANPEFNVNNFPGVCQAAVENTVWYTLQLSDPNNVGFEIDLQQITQTGDVSVVLLEATACDGVFSIFDFYCGPVPAVDTIQFGPVDETVTYYLMIGSSEADQGEFDLCISEIPPCFENNFCEDPLGISSAIDIGTLTTLSAVCPPTGPPDSTFVCILGCNEFADDDPNMSACLGNPPAAPTVWYTFQTDGQANILNISLTSQDFDAPAIQLWQDNGGCGNLIQIGLTQANLGCATGSGGELVANSTDVGAGITYYLSVAGINTAGGDFELCLVAIEEGSACVLDANVEITGRTFAGPLTGPFFPGETVSVCLNVNSYTSAGNGCQWFQGIVPVFGNGWDEFLSFEAGLGTPPVNATINGNPYPAPGQSGSPAGIWDWFSDANYHYPHCFYNIGDFDANGSLDICNGLYDENCVGPGLSGSPSGGPCWGGIPGDGDLLPPGWFHYNIQGACPQIGHPNVDWGDGACCGCTMGPWNFCFDLTVKPYPECELDMTTMDLTIGFVTFADGETGTWTGGPSICGQDEPVFEKLPGCCTDLQFLEDVHPPFCSGGVFTYALDNPAADFWEWTVDAPTSIVGASGGNGPSGTVIIDNLTNTGTTSEIVTYSFAGFDGGDCPSVILEVTVEIFAEITVDMDPFTVCSTPTNPYEIIPTVEGGEASSYMFLWHDGSTGETFQVTTPVAGLQYIVTVTDLVGCSGTASVVLDVYETFPVDIDAPILGQCVEDGFIDISASASGGMPDYTYEWTSPVGGMSSGPIVMTDESGQWLVLVTDSEGCVGADSVTVDFFEAPTVEVTPMDVAVCPDNQFFTQMNANVFGGEPPYLFEWTTPTSTVVTSFLLAEQAGLYTILVTDNNGCSVELDFEIFEAPSPMFDLGGPMTACQNDIFAGIVLEVPFDVSYLFYEWSTGEETQSIIVDTIGTYTVTVTNNGGCIGTEEFVLDIYPLSNFDIPDTFEFCSGNFGVIDAGPGFAEYEWSTGDDLQEIFVFDEELIFITVTDFNGCTYTDEVQVIEAQFLSPEIIGDSVICNGVPVDIIANPGFATYDWSTGEDGEVITVDTGGWYFVTVSDGDGCFGMDSVLVLDATPSPGITGEPNVCEGDSILLDAGSWSSVEWSTGESSPTIYVDTSGTYFVTVTDQFGCQNSTSMSVTINAPPDPTITGVVEFCDGGSATLDAGAGYSSYNWSTGATTQTTSPSASATIFLTVTNAGGCEGYDTINVTEAPALLPAITGDTVVCNAEAVDLDAGGGFVSYVWSSGDTEQVIAVTTNNTFIVTVTDSDGCTGTDEIVVVASAPDPMITGTDEVCTGESSTLTASAGFDTYLWVTGETSATINVTTANTYVVTVTDALGCTGTEMFDFTISPNPTPGITGSATFCTGNQTVLDAGSGYTDYQWTGGSSGQTLTVTASGTYTVTVTDGNGCVGTTSQMVTESTELVLNVQDEVICEGETATLIVGSFDTYMWSTNETSPTIDVTSSGTYSVTVTDNGGCSGTADIEVTVNQEPFATVITEAVICNLTVDGSVVDFSSLVTGGDTGGTWTDDDNSGSSGSFPVLDFDGVPEGVYTFTYMTNSAVLPCTEKEYLVTLTVEDCACPSPMLLDPSVLCTDVGLLNLDDLLIPGVTELGGTWTIISDPGGAAPATLNGSSFDANNADAGVYEVEYTLSGLPMGCPDSDSKLITVNLAPDAGVAGQPAQVCAAEDTLVGLTGLLTGGQTGGMWIETSLIPSTGGAFNGNVATFNSVSQAAGSYTFEYIVSGTAPCVDASTTVEVVVEALPVADAGDDGQLTCADPNSILGGTGSSTGAEFEYIWSTSSGVITDTFSLNTQVSSGGIYTLTVRNKETGCESMDDVEISLAGDLPTDLLFALDFPVCDEDPPARFEILNVTGGTGPYTYSLNGGAGTTSTVFNDLTPGDYILDVSDVNGCPYQTSFNIPPMMSLDATLEGELLILLGDDVTLTYNVNPGIADSVIWAVDGQVICVNCDTIIFAPTALTDVSLTIFDPNLCSITLFATVLVKVDRRLFVPNVFSPNGDGINEYVTVYSPSDVVQIDYFEVFSRWGEKLFRQMNFPPNVPELGWDGTFAGEQLLPGVFVYHAQVQYSDGVTEVIKGDITLLR